MKEDRDTVVPPMNDRMGPKFGMDSATNRTQARTETRMTTRCQLNANQTKTTVNIGKQWKSKN